MGSVREATETDLPRIKAMCDAYIGKDFYTEADLSAAYRDRDQYLIVYENEEGTAVAFLYMFVTSFGQAREILKIPDGLPALDGADDRDTVGIFKTTCTEEAYRGQGILPLLMEDCERRFRERGIRRILLDALKHPSGKVPAESALRKMTFRPLALIPHPWSDTDAYCPYCNNRFCRCDGILYVKEIG